MWIVTCKHCGKTKSLKDIYDLSNHICMECRLDEIFPLGSCVTDHTMGDLQEEMCKQAWLDTHPEDEEQS